MRLIFKLFLPLVILNTLFGNSYNDDLAIVSQIVGIILIGYCFFILHYFIRFKYTSILLLALILSKVAALIFKVNILYELVYSILFIVTGSYLFQKYLAVIKSQFILYFIISGLILFIQIGGWIPKFHIFNIYVIEYLNNYENIYGSSINYPNVFFTYGDRYSLFDRDQIHISNIQFRPSGIFHSNAFLGPFMLIGFFFIVTWYKKARNNFLFFMLTFFLLICGSKLVFFCSLICLIFNKFYLEDIYHKTLFIYFLSFLFYYVVFPIVFLTNFTFDAIVYSFGIRVIDQISEFGNFDFLFSGEIIESYSSLDKENQGLSGFFSLLIVILILFSLYLLFKKKFTQYFISRNISPELKFLYRCIFIWLVFVLFATPLLGNHLISFLIGLLFSPFISISKGHEKSFSFASI